MNFIPRAPSPVAEVSIPDWKARQAEAELQHQGQKEGQRAGADAEQRAARRVDAERGQAQQAQIDDRVGAPRRVAGHSLPAAPGRPAPSRRPTGTGTSPSPDSVTPDRNSASPGPSSRKPPQVEPRHPLHADILDQQGHEDQSQHRDGHVDPEDPAPVEEGGDEPAQRRPQHRPDQRREPSARPAR